MAFPAPATAARAAAALVVNRLGLHPPVDVEALLRAKVHLTRVDWPIDGVDAVLTGLASDPRDVAVYIRATDNLLRERFTMAHEFGHIMLPWHVPNPNCEVGDGDIDLPRFTNEDEADIFASCLLLPDRWLSELVQQHGDDMSQLLRELNAAEVTTAAALHALRRYLLAGWVFVGYRESFVIATHGTQLPSDEAVRAPSVVLREQSYDHGEALLNGFAVKWFRMSAPSALPEKSPTDERSDHQILMDAIALFEPDESKRVAIGHSANGKVGGGLREAGGRPAEETFQAIRHRCEQWDYAGLLQQPDFVLWLAQRARAIEQGTTKRRRGR